MWVNDLSHVIYAAEFFEDEYPHLNLNAKVEVLEKHGLRVAGLGGVFRGRVWYPRKTNETPSFSNQTELLAQTPRNERMKPPDTWKVALSPWMNWSTKWVLHY